MSLPEVRVRTKLAAEAVAEMEGKMLREEDIAFVLGGGHGPAKVLMPDGRPLAVYLPGVIPVELRESVYPTLHSLKNSYTSNRGKASGSQRAPGASSRSYARMVDSAIVGAFDPAGPKQYCRLSAWSREETERWPELFPLFKFIGEQFAEYVPDRYAAQARFAARTAPEWVIPGTPFTTITVNNTYPTGVHTDKGDLDEGFSTLATLRRGRYSGGILCFPEFSVGVDMQDGDLLLMDAHQWHGNTPMLNDAGEEAERDLNGRMVGDPGYERISIVSYFRTKMVDCGSAADEAERQRIYAENRNAAMVGEE